MTILATSHQFSTPSLAGDCCDVIVAGTGVIGLSVAWALLDRGLTVAVVGPRLGEHAGQASRAAGAMLPVFSEIDAHHATERSTIDTRERLAAHDAYPAWLERLTTADGAAVTLNPGIWVVTEAGRTESLEAITAAADAAGHVAERYSGGEVPGLDPPVASEALWLPTEASIDSALLMTALSDTVARHPCACWYETDVISVDPDQRRVRCADGTSLTGGEIVLAAGTAIPGLVWDQGRPWGIPAILAGRGVSLLLDAPAVRVPTAVRTPNDGFACGVHLVPRASGQVYLGGTNRLDTSPDPNRRATVDELASLTRDAVETLDQRVGSAEVISSRVGMRPYCADHRPLVGRTGHPHLLLATATYRCGVLLAPHLAALLAQEITEPGSLDEHPYRAQRDMPQPGIEHLLEANAAACAVEHLLRGGSLSPQATRELTAWITVALRAIHGDVEHPSVTAQRCLWDTAPVVEVIPSLLALADRMQPR
ncbi:NAD(P)/FAD-dependent oxidoreductase [Saccharopolyspora hattusasensis]|uniref:NAD(P)/FAD-dependent oxidoreductase n=1 Tax=Saccharopolyspora hattusasensis TaxID=1128679 RepID=UPI003D95FDA5